MRCSRRDHLLRGVARSRCRRTGGSGPRPGLLDHGERPVERLVRDLRRIVAVLEQDEAERVAHRIPDADLPLQLRVLEELCDRRDRPGEVLVPRDPVHPREPGERVLPVRVERRARLRVDEVRDVRDEALVELLRPAVARGTRRGSGSLSVDDDDVAVDTLPLREPALDGREVLGVRVDVLEVVDLDLRLRRELLERRRARQAGGFAGVAVSM